MMVTESDFCAFCKKIIDETSRSRWCSDRCKAREWEQREIERANGFMALPVARIPAELQSQLPLEQERAWVECNYVLRSRAPASARGYRLGTLRRGGQRMRWFPSSAGHGPTMFRLEPFELPRVPLRGRYAVVYTDETGAPLGEPGFTIEVGFRDKQLLFSAGDRSFRPRLRQKGHAALGER